MDGDATFRPFVPDVSRHDFSCLSCFCVEFLSRLCKENISRFQLCLPPRPPAPPPPPQRFKSSSTPRWLYCCIDSFAVKKIKKKKKVRRSLEVSRFLLQRVSSRADALWGECVVCAAAACLSGSSLCFCCLCTTCDFVGATDPKRGNSFLIGSPGF